MINPITWFQQRKVGAKFNENWFKIAANIKLTNLQIEQIVFLASKK